VDKAMSLKMTLGADCRRIAASPELSYDDLLEQIALIFRLTKDQVSQIVIGYLDDEKDLCIVSSTEELSEGFRCSPGVLRLTLSFKTRPEPQPEVIAVPPRRKCMQRRIQALRELEDRALKMMETDLSKAIELFSQQVEASPRWQLFRPLYNIACCHALLGDSAAALAVLSKSIHAGFRDIDHMKNDPDLASLRETADFQELCALIPTLGQRPPRCQRRCGQWNRPAPTDQAPEEQPAGSPVQAVFDFVSGAVHQIPNAAALLREQLQVLGNGLQAGIQAQFAADVRPAEPKPEVPQPEPEQPAMPIPEVQNLIPDDVDPLYRSQLTCLQEMGFTDTDANLAALMQCEGDLSTVLSRLLEN